MAKNGTNSLGGIVAVVLGLAIVGGLAATPFYLNHFRVDARLLDDSLEDEIEQVRRVALNIDENLSALSDLYAAEGDEAGLDADEINALLEADPNVLSTDVVKDLERSARELQTIESKDMERGTKIENGNVEVGRPNLRAAPAAMRSKYLQAHAKLLQTADSAIKRLQTVSAGSENAQGHLGANRVSAILYLAKGRIERNRAEFEQLMAARLWRHAEKQVETVAALRRNESAAKAQIPKAALAKIEESIADQDGEIDELRREIEQLEREITTAETRIAALENEAQYARLELARLDATGAAIYQEGSRYQELSEVARENEAKAAALRNGTLDGAVLAGDEFDELLTAPYEGGEPRIGARDKKLRLEQRRKQLAGFEQSRDWLTQRQTEFRKLARNLQAKADAYHEDAEARLAQIARVLEEADRHLEAADKASDSAMASFKQAERHVGPAINAASRWVRDARQAKAEATEGLESDRLDMILSDGDMEGSLHCLKAEIAYHAALTRTLQVTAIRAGHKARVYIGATTGNRPPALDDEKLAPLFKEAADKLKVARDTYQDADKSISKTRARTPRGTVQGRDYLWQVQIGQAAVHLVGAALAMGTPDAHAEKVAAYELLKQAAQGREQSPLLTPAVETLLLLQKVPE